MTCFNKINSCRICKGSNFRPVVDLGEQCFTGVFPEKGEYVEKAPLELISCNECGLLQLAHNFDQSIMYGKSYGYRSSQNSWMVNHLKDAVNDISQNLNPDDLVVEIGSNDSTALSLFPKECRTIGIDPSAEPLRGLYPSNSQLISQFFTWDVAEELVDGNGRAKIVMSFAMFYDLPDPVDFAKNISRILTQDGVWVFEQSYLVSMLQIGAFDTICHEHLEYYTIRDIKRILGLAGLKLLDVSFNDANGGSFRVHAGHAVNGNHVVSKSVEVLIGKENKVDRAKLLNQFLGKISNCKQNLVGLVEHCKKNSLNLYGIGASTKGNVLLQYCGLTDKEIKAIGEINPDKIGKECPGSGIPIISEDEALADELGVYLILPWHFKSSFLKSENFKTRPLVFPLPEWEIINV